MKLIDLLDKIEKMDENSSIYIKSSDRIGEDVDVIILPIYLVPDGGKTPDGLQYLLEVYLVKEVLDVWSNWRNGKEPTNRDKLDAIEYFVEHDAYLPPEE